MEAATCEDRPSTLTLVNLPFDVTVHILQETEWDDLLRLRKTCRAIHAATNIKTVWLSLLDRYMKKTPGIIYLERPPVDYSLVEIEHILLRWKSALMTHSSSDSTPARQRDLIVQDDAATVYLIPGGRWLLVSSIDGNIDYYDLERDIPTKESLFQTDPDIISVISMLADVYVQDSVFTTGINLAVYGIGTIEQNQGDILPSIEIWHITFIRADNKQVIDLQAAHTKTVLFERDVLMLTSFSLLGTHLAYSTVYPLAHMSIFNWEKVPSGSHEYPRVFVDPGFKVRKIHLLPHHRLLLIGQTGYGLLDYSVTSPTGSLFDDTLPTVMPFRQWFTPEDICSSAIFRGDNQVRVVLSSKSRIYGTTISLLDDASSENGTIIELANIESEIKDPSGFRPMLCLGHNQAMIYYRRSPLAHVIIVQYNWHNDTGGLHKVPADIFRIIPDGGRLSSHISYDEGSGRVIMLFNRNTEMRVVDLGHDLSAFQGSKSHRI